MSETLTESAAFKATQEAIQKHAAAHTMAEVINHCLPNKAQENTTTSISGLAGKAFGALHIYQNESPTGTSCLTKRPSW